MKNLVLHRPALLLLLVFLAPHSFAQDAGVVAAIRGLVSVNNLPTEIGKVIQVGDLVETESDSVVQLLLNDGATFTLGANASLNMDAFFVSDTQADVRATVNKGPFKFFSGAGAKLGPDAMKVKLPSGTIGIRGTQVAGEVISDEQAQILLVGPTENSFGERPGAISIDDGSRVVDVLRPGFIVDIQQGVAGDPVQATPEVQDRLNNQTSITPSDFAQALEGQIENQLALSDDSDTTVVSLAGLDLGFFEAAVDAAGNEQVNNISAGRGTAQVLAELAQRDDYADIFSKLSDATAPALTGQAIYRVVGANLVDSWNPTYGEDRTVIYCQSPCGSFNTTATIDFDQDTLAMQMNGNIAGLRADNEGNQQVSFDFAFDGLTALSNVAVAGSVINDNSRNDPVDASTQYLYAGADVTLTNPTGGALETGAVNVTQGEVDGYRNNLGLGTRADWTITNFELNSTPGSTSTGTTEEVRITTEVNFLNVDDSRGGFDLSAAIQAVEVNTFPTSGGEETEVSAVGNSIVLREAE